MPTCRDIVTTALKLGKVVGVNAQPTGAEASFGMDALQSFYLDLAANGMFGALRDRIADTDYTAVPGERVRIPSTFTVTYPTEIQPCHDRRVRPPYDLSLVEVVTTDTMERSLKIFEAGRGEWVELVGLTLNGEAPLASRGMMGLGACLASYGGFVAAFTPTLDATIAPLVKSFRAGLIGKGGADRDRLPNEYY